jgi:transmembrane sensor
MAHTPHLNVEISGTEFNVSNRRHQTEVVLHSGKIHLNINQAGKAVERLLMQPGELVAVSGNLEKTVNPEKYGSWVSKTLILDDTS